MPSDVRLTHSHRLPGPSHSINLYNGTHLPSQPFTVNASSGPSTQRISQVALEEAEGVASGSSHVSSYAPSSGRFPSTYADQGVLARHKRETLERAVEARGGAGVTGKRGHAWGRDGDEDAWGWDHEDIYIRPSLLPTHSSAYGGADDPLPSEQHISYPLGRPIEPRPPNTHPRALLPHHVQVSRVFLAEAAAWNSGIGQGAEAGAGAASGGGGQPSAPAHSGQVGTTDQATGGGGRDEALWKPLTGLPAYLASLKPAAVAASTTQGASAGGSSRAIQAHACGSWPFVNFGPGTSLVRRRDEDDWDDANSGPGTAAAAAREVWLEHDFERLLPLGREGDPLEYLATSASRQAAAPISSNTAAAGATDEASTYLDRIDTEMTQRLLTAQKGSAGQEVHKEESEASAQLKKLFASGSSPALPAITRSQGRHAQDGRQKQQSRPLPSLLLDRFGGDAEELRALLVASSGGGATPRDQAGSSSTLPGDRGIESEWVRRARKAREATMASTATVTT